MSTKTVWILVALMSGYPILASQQQRVVVDVQLDSTGKITDAKATSGNPLLFARATSVAKTRRYRRDCDSSGNPVGSSVTVFVDFDENGNFYKVEFPIRVEDRLIAYTILKRVEPEYPNDLRKAGIKGIVILEARVDEHGNVTVAKAVRGDSRLTPHAIRALLQWKYRPVYFGCEPVPFVTTVTITFP
jgi:hypothetical protein